MESGLELLVTTEVAFTRFFLSRRIHHARNFRKSCGRDADSLFAPMFVAKKKKDIARARHVQYVSKSWPNDVSSFSTSDSNKWESGGEGGGGRKVAELCRTKNIFLPKGDERERRVGPGVCTDNCNALQKRRSTETRASSLPPPPSSSVFSAESRPFYFRRLKVPRPRLRRFPFKVAAGLASGRYRRLETSPQLLPILPALFPLAPSSALSSSLSPPIRPCSTVL